MATGEQGDITRSELKKNWGVLTALVSKDFKIKYRRSVLGVVWSVLNPLLMMVVMTAVFSYMFKFNIEHFPLYLILGNILFGLMSTATTTAMKSIVDSSSLIKKIRIEKAIFPVEKVLFALVNFAFSLIAAVCVMIYLQVFPSWQIILLPVLIIFVMLFSTGLSLLLAALGCSSMTSFISGRSSSRPGRTRRRCSIRWTFSNRGCSRSCNSIPCTIT